MCSKKFRNIHSKTHVLEPHFSNFIKKRQQLFSCEYGKIFTNSFFYKSPLVAAFAFPVKLPEKNLSIVTVSTRKIPHYTEPFPIAYTEWFANTYSFRN